VAGYGRPMEVKVIDVSDYQPGVNWSQVLGSGRHGGICKATEGVSYTARSFVGNWNALGQLHAPVRGAYHFAQPAKSSAALQANHFLQVLAPLAVTPRDMLVLDIEVGDGNLSTWALDFLGRVEQATGIRPWLYSYGPFITAHLRDANLARYPLWIAAYSSKAPAVPKPWGAYRLWQHTDAALVPGAPGKVDESIGNYPDPIPPAPPAPPVPTTQEVVGVKVTAGNITVAGLDDQGRGWVSVPANISRLLFLACQGSAPARDQGYWPPVSWDVNDSGSETIVTLSGQPHERTVVYYSILEEA
jgi:GH25 family lysozyme M1 (1,4-beta-N-acetylmuramidase)